MTNLTKIQLTNHRDENNVVQVVSFSRYDNGLIIGAASLDGSTRFGEDPTQLEQRFFVNLSCAIQYVKDKCIEYCGREDVDFLTTEGNPMVQTSRQMPQRRAM